MRSIKIEIEDLVDWDSLAEEYCISKEELIIFHNRHCALHEMLPGNLPKYIKYIYVPADRKKIREEKHVRGSVINLPEIPAMLSYSVLIREFPIKVQIHYMMDIQREYNDIISVYRQKLFVNDCEVELMVEKMMETAGEAFYPLKISLNKDGRIKKIVNEKEIQKHWKEEYLPRIQQYYTGETADELIEKLDHFYEDIAENTEALNRNLFFTLFFLPLYTSYPEYQKRESLNIYFPYADKTVSYTASFLLHKIYTDQDRILLHIKGEQEDNNQSESLKIGNLDLIYKLDKKTKEITSIEGRLSTFHYDEEIVIYIDVYQHKSYI